MNDEIKVVFTATDGISAVAQKIAQAFTQINKTSSLTAQQGLQQVSNAIGEKLNRSIRLSTDRTNQFLAALDKVPKKVQETGAAMVTVANGNAKLATSFRDLAKAPAPIQKALESVMTQSERSRLSIYRFAQELQSLSTSGNVGTKSLETRFNQLMSMSGLSADRQRSMWTDFFMSLPSEQKKASDLQIADLKRTEKEREAAVKKAMSDQQKADKQALSDTQKLTKEKQKQLQQQVKDAERAAKDEAAARRQGFSSAINFGRIGLQSALLGSQLASGIASGPGGLLGAVGNAAFLARPLMMAGPAGLAVAGGVAALTAALTGLSKVLEVSSSAAKSAAQNFLQMQAVASLRGLPSNVPQQQADIGQTIARRYGFRLPEVQSANLNLTEAGLYGSDAINSAGLIAKAENKPIEEVSKDLADLIQSGQTESFTQKYRITSARVLGLRKPSLSAAYPSSKEFFSDIQDKLGPTVGQLVQQEPGERMGATWDHILQTIGSPVWQAFLKILQPISEFLDRMADEFDRIFKDQAFLDSMSKAFDQISAAMQDIAPVMGDFAKTFARFVTELIVDFIKSLPTIIRLVGALVTIMDVWMKLVLILIAAVKLLIKFLSPLAPLLKAIWEMWKAWSATLLQFLDLVYDVLNGTKSLDDILAALEAHLKGIGSSGPGASEAIKHLGDLLRYAADQARDLLGLLAQLAGIGDILINVRLVLPEFNLPTLPEIKLNISFPDLGELIFKPFIELKGNIEQLWLQLWALLVQEAEEGSRTVVTAIESIKTVVTTLVDNMSGGLRTVVDLIVSIPERIESAWNALEVTVGNGVNAIIRWVANLADQVTQILEGIPGVGDIIRSSIQGPGTPAAPGGIKPGTTIIQGSGGAGLPFGASISSGGGFPNPFDKKNKKDKDFNSDTGALSSYDTSPTQVSGPSGYDVQPSGGDTTINVYVQGGDFSDRAAVQQRARELGDSIGFNLRRSGAIQVP